MSRSYLLWLTIGAFALNACGQFTTSAGSPPASTPVVITAVAGTASVTTVEPVFVTEIPPGQATSIPASTIAPTPIPRVPGGLGPTELKYRILAEFPNLFFCDPDYYPIARDDELDLARQRFPELQANQEEFDTILVQNNLKDVTAFSDDQKLLIYREHKRLAAILFELVEAGYQFQIQVAEAEGGNGERISGVIDGQGAIAVQKRETTIATCPICLASNTLIDTPSGFIPVQDLHVGMPVWTLDRAGKRIAMPLIQIGRTLVPTSHQVIHLVLADGRSLHVSSGHPAADGRAAGQLQMGDYLDGARVVSAKRVPYTGLFTFDILPDGSTGFYWANGILLGSTLHAGHQNQ